MSEIGNDTCICSHACTSFSFVCYLLSWITCLKQPTTQWTSLYSLSLLWRVSHTIKPLVQKTIAVFTLCHGHPNRHPLWVLPIEMGDKRGKRQHGKVPKPAKGICFPPPAQGRTAGRCVWVRSDSSAYRAPSLSLPPSSSPSVFRPPPREEGAYVMPIPRALWEKEMKAIHWERSWTRCMHCFIFTVIHKIRFAEKNPHSGFLLK